jgi:intracellular multiplication protein IcmT
MLNFSSTASWRDSARPIRFFMLDGKSVFPVVILLMHIRLWTFVLSLVTVVFFSVLIRFGITPRIFLRMVRNRMAGPRRYANPRWLR